MFFIIQKIIVKTITGAIFLATLLLGGLAGLIGLVVRSQMPNFEMLADSPVRPIQNSTPTPIPRRMAVVTAAKSDKRQSRRR